MSAGGPNSSGRYWNPGTRRMLILWAVVVVTCYVFYEFVDKKHSVIRDDLQDARTTVDKLTKRVDEGNPAVTSELNSLKDEFQRLSQEFDRYGRALGTYDDQFRRLADQITTAESERAVARAQVAGLATQVRVVRQQLDKLKSLEADWEAQMASLLDGEEGRRIAGSPSHLQIVLAVLERERPTSEEILLWETQVQELAAPIDRALADQNSTLALAPEHEPKIVELTRQVSATVSDLEQRQLRLTAVLKATAEATPASETLGEVVAARRAADAIRLDEERSQLLAEERAQTEQAIRDAELEKERMLREATEAAIRANADIELKKIEDAVAEVRREEDRRQADLKARIERERAEARFEQALPELRRYLVPFITLGNKHIIRNKWTFTEEKKPLSLGAIQAIGALENTANGLTQFYFLAGGQQNDRPTGVFRGNFIGGNVRPELVPDVVRAQNLLKEFGDMLVEKEMLEP